MIRRALLALSFVASFPAGAAAQCDCPPSDWQSSFVSGDNGLQATEVRQFVAFGDPPLLYAAIGGWMDQTAPKGNAKIIRLDSSDGKWVQEVDFGGTGTTTGGLASLHFTQSQNSQPIDVWTLVAATWSGANTYTRNEIDHKWYKTDFGTGQIRSFGVHKDAVANETFSFAGGKPGIFRGQLKDQRLAGASPIAWTTTPELNTVNMNLPLCSGGGRVTGFAEARGKLFAAACWRVFERTDGPIGKCSGPSQVEVAGKCQARWERFWDDPLAGQGESGLRGLTQIMYNGEQVLLVGSEVANAHITRLDPVTAESVVEFNVDKYLDNLWGAASGYKIIPYNSPMPLWYGADGVGRRILGFESWLPGAPKPDMVRKYVNLDASPQVMNGEGFFFIRNSSTNYQLTHIPASASPQPQTAIRDCIASPFKNECNAQGQDCVLYCGGFDSNKSTTQTPCTVAPCTFPPLVAVPTHGTGFIVKGRLSVGAATESAPAAAEVPNLAQPDEPPLPPQKEGEQ